MVCFEVYFSLQQPLQIQELPDCFVELLELTVSVATEQALEHQAFSEMLGQLLVAEPNSTRTSPFRAQNELE